MIPKSGYRFSEKIMLKKTNRVMPFRRGLLRRLQAAVLSNKPRSDYTFQSKASTGTDAGSAVP